MKKEPWMKKGALVKITDGRIGEIFSVQTYAELVTGFRVIVDGRKEKRYPEEITDYSGGETAEQTLERYKKKVENWEPLLNSERIVTQYKLGIDRMQQIIDNRP